MSRRRRKGQASGDARIGDFSPGFFGGGLKMLAEYGLCGVDCGKEQDVRKDLRAGDLKRKFLMFFAQKIVHSAQSRRERVAWLILKSACRP